MPSASCLSAITAASIVPDDSEHDGTQIREIRSFRLAAAPPHGSSPHSPPPVVWPTPPAVASPPPAEAMAGADASTPESPDHRRIWHTRPPSTVNLSIHPARATQ